MYSFCAMYSFRMSFCSVPDMRDQSTPCFSADRQIHGPDDRRGRVDGHRNGDVAERDAAEQDLHVFERADGDAALAHFAFGSRVIGIVTHERWQIESDREAGLALAQQIKIAAVGFLGRGEARELAHGPELAAIHVAMDAAGVRELAGRRDVETLDVLLVRRTVRSGCR